MITTPKSWSKIFKESSSPTNGKSNLLLVNFFLSTHADQMFSLKVEILCSTWQYFLVPVLLKVARNQHSASAMAAGIREFSVKLPKDRCVLVHLGTSLASWSSMMWKGTEDVGENLVRTESWNIWLIIEHVDTSLDDKKSWAEFDTSDLSSALHQASA